MAHIEKRSLIRLGRDCLVVTVPAAWARFYGLKPGDKVEVISNGKMTVKPLKPGEEAPCLTKS